MQQESFGFWAARRTWAPALRPTGSHTENLRVLVICPTNSNGVPTLPSPCSRYPTFSGGSPSSTYNFESSAYAEDRWLITDRLLVEPGVRFDWDEIIRTPLVSPRLSGTYVLDNSGNTKFSAGIGLIYDPTLLFLIARPFAGQRTDYFFNSAGALTGTVPTTFSVDRNALQAPRFVNWSRASRESSPPPST
jgi:hypothetical protein